MNAWKKISVAAVLAAMLVTMAACGSSTPSTAESSTASVSESAPAVAEVTEESYKAEVKRIFDAINEKSAAMSGVDATDPVAAAEAMKPIIAEIAPLYAEMGALTPPDALKDTHATIADGCTASVEILNLSNQMFGVAAGTVEGDAATLTAEMQTKIAELTPKAAAFGEALQTLLA